ncbi:hypothetical protein [Allosphingosinicella deserti]|uniref:PASTA domain-containing protein n=1 Tax=Allosphingosinicella deserti TaxID=2116704 RepID=A0A2P7QLH2_9SPHN|nr:hypothetical protein [Sphingomonas deserti]PSJ38821.1 hypothetical protein C7I55_15960 [Sphingomonas deserti]
MTQISWSLRLIAADGNAVPGLSVQLQVFDMAAGWKRIADSSTGSDGRIRGKADDGVAKPAIAPMLRLVETANPAALLGGVPGLAASAAGVLNADFGDIVHIAEAARPAPRRGGLVRAGLEAPQIGGIAAGIAAAAAPTTAVQRDVEARLAERETELGRTKNERDDLAVRLAAAEAKSADLQERLTQSEIRIGTVRGPIGTGSTPGPVPPPAPGPAVATLAVGALSLGDFATRLGGEIDSAQTALKARGFSLGSVSINAKTIVEGGSSLVFPETAELKTVRPGSLSDVAITFNPNQAPETGDGGVQVPDIRFLTEGAARRVLASVGLVLEVSQGPLGINPDCAPGQAMLQAPGAGNSAARGSTVLAVFAAGT